MRSNHRELKKRAWAANLEIARRGLAIYTFGNASAFDREAGLVAIKPSGVAYEDLSVEDIVVLDLEGKIVEGRLRPSSDTRTHLVLFREMPGLGGVVHTHSTYATGWAQAASPIPILGTTHADYLAERSEEHTSELQSRLHLVCRLLLEKKKKTRPNTTKHKQRLRET